MSRSKVRRAIASLVAVSGAVLSVASGSGYARVEQDDPGASGISQYVEMVPTAAGPKAPGITKEQKAPLPRRATKALESAPPETAEPLEKLATSSSYGAPTRRAKPSKPIERSVERTPERAVAVGTTVEAIATSSDSRLLALLALMLAVAVSAVALAARNARRY